MSDVKSFIAEGKAVLGIEFGSTRIKAVLVGENNEPIAQGAHDWENQLLDGRIWSYSLDMIWEGLQDCYANMVADVKAQYDVELTKLGAIGFSGMMHGYMPFNQAGDLLVPFRTWRNTITGEASEELTKLLNFHIPQRWTVAHLYQAVLNGEEHVTEITFVATLAEYIHWQLTGEKVAGIGEASGMFPIDSTIKDYDADMMAAFDKAVKEKNSAITWNIKDILPKVLVAGDVAGTLTAEGAKKLDPTGKLEPGCPLCPPEGDAGTGMAATNAVAERTGNVSAGTSVFAMIVLEKALKEVHEEIDMVTTPMGSPVAMVHCNNCTSDLNAWVNLFKEFAEAFGVEDVDMTKLFKVLYNKALEGDADCGGLLAYNYFSGEHVTNLEAGRPMFVRTPDSKFNLANFMRVHLFTALGALKTGLDILIKEEGVTADVITGHGGLFKTKGVGQSILAAAMNTSVTVMETAGEGGAWGIGLLAAYMRNKEEGETFDAFLLNKVFKGETGTKMDPDPEMVAGFDEFIKRYAAGLAIEKAAVENLK